ncbi:ABC transporter permease subunit, partial [Paraburkholderia phosphatilytica]|uniref:ABC transporter permease subunit n=1 Tax=Paraburkholderia phosphatilytica TaxID=2282883 RepID=UPI0013DF74B8
MARDSVALTNHPVGLHPESHADVASPPDEQGGISHLEHVRRRYWGRYAASAAIVALLAYVVLAFAHGQIEWRYVGRFVTARSILTGLVNTIVMTILAMALGIALGVLTAIMRLSSNPVLGTVAGGYVWLFRGTPVILQLLLWFNLALVFPTLGIP